MPIFIDGLLEGHEGPVARLAYRCVMFLYIVLTLFGGLCNLPLVMHDGYHVSYFIQGLTILALLCLSLFLIRSYRNDNMDPKFRYATAFLIAVVFLLDIAAILVFASVLEYEVEVAPATAAPTAAPTPAPTGPPTPSPNVTPSPANMTSPEWLPVLRRPQGLSQRRLPSGQHRHRGMPPRGGASGGGRIGEDYD